VSWTLQEIPKQRRQLAHRLFQCLVTAIRSFCVEELVEILAIEFDEETAPHLIGDWWPENTEEAVLSACTTLISVVDNRGSKVVQFSHFSVKEFLTSDRLLTSDDGNIRHYHIPLDGAHAILARACLTVLLQLDETVDKQALAGFPLASYSVRHWVDHAKFDGVASRVKRAMEQLFNPNKPYLAAWTWIYDMDRGHFQLPIDELPERRSAPRATALYYAVLCGFSKLADYLISTHGEDVNIRCGPSRHSTPLQAASSKGHVETVRILLDRGTDVDIAAGYSHMTPLCLAYQRGHLEVMQLLLDYGTNVDVRYRRSGLISHYASSEGNTEVVRLLMQYKADVNAIFPSYNGTPLHLASICGHEKVVMVLLEHGASVNALDKNGRTSLYVAAHDGRLPVVRLLLRHGADVHIQAEDGQNPLDAAISCGYTEVAQLLLEYGAKEG